MDEQPALAEELSALIGEQVIIDVTQRLLYLGKLRKVGREVFVLDDADVHFCDDSQTTTEFYIIEAKKNDVRPNRSTVYVMRREVLSISRLDDIIVY